ncbi:hypothetical protein Psch_03216 [Pelotomaculum schinkii]|uniref:Helix-turn-helix domain protein n=1 Tax=Pelotomaculum schinkii TaxID=78350 RepID=A0A4Y7RBG1_9FIRM|nr:helix-turn-helix domain-containing protein [Pelotomaculum schinkii]TEB06172.1 hypothetical protein Psch_03216 [Pelotomaculum schinkii]
MMTDKTLIMENPKLKKGFTSVPNAVMMARGLSIGAKLIYGLLMMFAWQENECFPGQERLAQVAEISTRQVQRYLIELREYGLITWRRRGQNQTNVYYIKDIKTVERLKMPDTTNMSHPNTTNMPGPDTTCMSYKEYSVENNVVVEEATNVEVISKDDQASSIVVNDGAAFDLPVAAMFEDGNQELLPAREEKRLDELPAWEIIRANVRAVAGADVSVSFAQEIVRDYSLAKVDSVLSELRRQLYRGADIKRVGGWLRYALENDIKPDQPARAKTTSRRDHSNNKNTKKSSSTDKKKAFIRTLYL